MRLDPLLPHQMDALRFMTEAERGMKDGVILQHIMRSRKTSTVLTWLNMKRLTGGCSALVVCPPRVMPVWEGMKGLYLCGGDVDVVSSGALSSGDPPFPRPFYDFVVVDEIHQYRNYSNRFKRLRKMTEEATFRIGLSGTLIDKDMEELFYVMQLVCPDFWGTRNRTAFRKTYCEQINPHFDHSPWVIKAEHEKPLMEELKKYMHTYKDDGEIRPPEHETVPYDLNEEQVEWIADLEARRVIPAIKDAQTSFSPAHIHGKVIQVESGFLLHDERVVKEFPSDKYDKLGGLLERHKERVLVWYRYSEEKQRIKKMGIARDRTREFSQQNLAWWRDKEDAVLLCHPRSAGAGIDFSAADVAVFITPNPSTVDLMQAFYRLSKVGDGTTKIIYHLVSNTERGRGQYERIWDKMEGIKNLYVQGMSDAGDKISG